MSLKYERQNLCSRACKNPVRAGISSLILFLSQKISNTNSKVKLNRQNRFRPLTTHNENDTPTEIHYQPELELQLLMPTIHQAHAIKRHSIHKEVSISIEQPWNTIKNLIECPPPRLPLRFFLI